MTNEERVRRLRLAQAQQRARQEGTQPDVVMQTPDGGRVVRDAQGNLSFSSPAFSTNDPAKVQEIMQGASGGDVSRAGFQEQVIAANPVAARGATAMQGVPFVGSYLDEAASAMFGEQAGRNVLAAQEAMQETRPGETAALQVGAGVASAIPLAAAAPVGSIMGQGTSMAGKVARGAVAGMGAGAAEGAIYGSGVQNGGRGRNAGRQALVGGAIGGAIGGVAPVASRGVSNLIERARGTPERAAGAALGVSPESASLLGAVVDADPGAANALNRSGQTAMLADVGPTASGVVDYAIQSPGTASRTAKDRIEGRAGGMLGEINKALDDVLGAPEGVQTAQRAVRDGVGDAMPDAYARAYAEPIDYSKAAGRRLEGLIPRLPDRVIRAANDLMRVEGVTSPQIMASVAEDGTVSMVQMPSVQQWDYIKRGLQQLAEGTEGTGAFGGKTPIGRAYAGLAREIRSTLGGAIPAYNEAVETAADAISQQRAIRDGARVLSRRMARDEVSDLVEGMTGPEVAALKQGIRSQIDDTLARVSAVASDPNLDAREARAALNMLTSRESRDKLETVLGARDAGRVLRVIDEASVALGLRAATARGSQTAGRKFTQDFVEDITAPSGLTQLKQLRPIEAAQAITQTMTKTAPGDIAEKQGLILAEVSDVLTRSGLPEAQQALQILSNMSAAQPASEAQARFVANAFTAAVSGGTYQGGTNIFSNRGESGYTAQNVLR